jgi:large subunit ribosomal protein L9
MQVIIKNDTPGLGKQGQVIKVKDGYARNFLLPKGLVLEANPANVKKLQLEKERKSRQEAKEKAEAQVKAKKIEGTSYTIAMLVSEGEDLYGAVTASDITQALEQEGLTVDKKDIIISEPIKKLGIYEAGVRFHSEVIATVKVWVVKK